MDKIQIHEAVTEAEIQHFWKELNAYHERDIFPDPEDEDLEYFLGNEYRADMESIHDRQKDRARYLFFRREGREIGFALAVIYDTEDFKCFLMDFCVYPQFRGNGTGVSSAASFLTWAKENGAAYVELNSFTVERTRFWKKSGFVENGADEWGDTLMILWLQKD